MLDKSYLSRKLKSFRKHPLDFLKSEVDSVWYWVRCLVLPYNVVKAAKLPRSWCDRDHLMLHIMFQIIVDFVELEQPFLDWEVKHKKKRYTDLDAMKRYVDSKISPEGLKSYHYDGISDEEILSVDKRTLERYQIEKEILYLYEWYKNEKYEFDFVRYYEATGSKLELGGGRFNEVATGKTPLITWHEFHELEEEHDLVCANMLKRILAVRDYLWT